MPKQPIIENIWDSWDFHIEEDLARLNRRLKVMESEFKQNNVPYEDYHPYVKQKFYELIQKVDG